MIKPIYFRLLILFGCINFIILLGGIIGGMATVSPQGKLTTATEASLFIGLIGLGLDFCTFAICVAYHHCHHHRHQIHAIEENKHTPCSSIPAQTAPVASPPLANSNELESDHLISTPTDLEKKALQIKISA